MALKAIIPSGVTEIVVNGLHQWDYGQELEIHCDGLPATVQVHFACGGMVEADVRSCAFINGVATVSIPDRCIEQTTPITAWVYCINDESGRTDRTITLPIIARAKPTPSTSVPTVISDRYTELVTAINEQVAALTRGEVTAAKAVNADNATNATNAKKALNADNATDATNAVNATTSEGLKVKTNQPTVDIEVKEFGDHYTATIDAGVYLVILSFVDESGERHDYFSGVGYIGSQGEWASYEISLGEEMFIFFIEGANYPQKSIGINIRINKGMTLGRSGTLKMYKIADLVT